MTSLEQLKDLIAGVASFAKDANGPSSKKHWEKASRELGQFEDQKYWLKSLEPTLYHTLNVNSNSNLDFQRIVAKEIQGLDLSPRLKYYERRIDKLYSHLFEELFEDVNKADSTDLSGVKQKLRWLINRVNKIEDENRTAVFSTLKMPHSPVDSELVAVCNYFTAVYLKKSLVAIYRQICIIDSETSSNWQDDVFIMKSLVDRFDGPTYTALKDYTFKYMGEDPTYLIDLYAALKKIYYNSFSSRQNFSFSEIDLKVEIRKLENLAFLIVIKGDIVGDKVELNLNDVLEGKDIVIDKVYDEIRYELSQLKYPNDRVFLLGEKINIIRETLNDEVEEINNYLFESIPRKLIRKLQSELEMIKANPKIDLKEFDRDNIKPVKTALSVPQLAFLFKMLEDNQIIAPENRSDLYSAICNSFRSKASDSISSKSFQNQYLAIPDNSTKTYWKEKFIDFYNQIKIIK